MDAAIGMMLYAQRVFESTGSRLKNYVHIPGTSRWFYLPVFVAILELFFSTVDTTCRRTVDGSPQTFQCSHVPLRYIAEFDGMCGGAHIQLFQVCPRCMVL